MKNFPPKKQSLFVTNSNSNVAIQLCVQSIRTFIKHIMLYALPLIVLIRPDRRKIALLIWLFAFQLLYVIIGEFSRHKKEYKDTQKHTKTPDNTDGKTEDTPVIRIDPQRMEIIAQKLEENNSHLVPDLTIKKLGTTIKVPTDELSIYFNHYLNTPFKTYINQKRIDHSITLVESKIDTYTVDYIAQSSGFQNRTTYYRAFKRVKGVSPTEYYANYKSKK